MVPLDFFCILLQHTNTATLLKQIRGEMKQSPTEKCKKPVGGTTLQYFQVTTSNGVEARRSHLFPCIYCDPLELTNLSSLELSPGSPGSPGGPGGPCAPTPGSPWGQRKKITGLKALGANPPRSIHRLIALQKLSKS